MKSVFKLINLITLFVLMLIVYFILEGNKSANLFLVFKRNYKLNLDTPRLEVFVMCPYQTNLFVQDNTSYTFMSSKTFSIELIESTYLQEIDLDKYTYYLYELDFLVPALELDFYEEVVIDINTNAIKLSLPIGIVEVSNFSYKQLSYTYNTASNTYLIETNINLDNIYPYLNENILDYYTLNGSLILKANEVLPGINYIDIYYEDSILNYYFYNDIISDDFFDYSPYLKEGEVYAFH